MTCKCSRARHATSDGDVLCLECVRKYGAKLASHGATRKWPRCVSMVALYVGNQGFAERVVTKAASGEELYIKVVREAWRTRRSRQWQTKQRKK